MKRGYLSVRWVYLITPLCLLLSGLSMCVCTWLQFLFWGGRGASLQSSAMTAHTTAGRSGDTPQEGRRGSGVERSVSRQRRNAPHSAFLTALRQAFEGYQQTAGAGAAHPNESRSQWVPVNQNSSFKESRSELFHPDLYRHSLLARPFIESWVFIYSHWGTKIIRLQRLNNITLFSWLFFYFRCIFICSLLLFLILHLFL